MSNRCAKALSWGMPYELFWHGPISAYLQYRAADCKRVKEKQEDENRIAWLHGAYIIRAISHSLDGQKSPYPEAPIRPLTPEEEQKRQKMTDMIEKHNEEMRQIQEQQAAKLQDQLIAKAQEAMSHGERTDH